MGRLSGNTRNTIATPLLGLTLLFAVFAVGSAHRWAVVGFAGLSLASTLPYWGSRRAFSSRPPLLVFLGVCALLTALQVLPLPAALVGLLSPGKFNLVSDNAKAMQESMPGFFSLSLDPPATLKELVKYLGYLAFSFTALRLLAKKESKNKSNITGGVVIVACLVALTALGHKALGASTLFGIYDPEFAKSSTFLSPLLNSNHFAGLMALCAPAALGLAIHHRGKRRAFFVAALLLCSGACVLSSSRGGVIVLGIGLLLATGLSFVGRKGKGERDSHSAPKKIPVPQMVVGLCVFVMLGLATGNGVLEELGNTSADEITGRSGKIDMWRSSRPLVARFPITGIGRGAFEQAVSRVRPSSQFSYASLENEYLQAIVDWGLIGAFLAALALVWLGALAFSRWRHSAVEAGIVAGIAALALQNVVDFSLSLPGVALPVIALMAVLTSGKLVTSKSQRSNVRKIRHAGLVVVGAALFGVLALPVNRAARDEICPGICSVANAAEIWKRHPSDYAAAGRTAVALYNSQDQRAIPVLNQALLSNPKQWGLHLLAARWLQHSSTTGQAAVEFASALRNAPMRQVGGLVKEIVKSAQDPKMAARSLPRDGFRMPQIAHALRSLGQPEVSLAYAHIVMDNAKESEVALENVMIIALRQKDIALALRSSRRLHQLWPTANSVLHLAEVELASGNTMKSKEIVKRALGESQYSGLERMRLTQLLSKILISKSNYVEAREALMKALKIPSAGNQGKASIHRQLADIEMALGNRAQAAVERQIADELAAKQR